MCPPSNQCLPRNAQSRSGSFLCKSFPSVYNNKDGQLGRFASLLCVFVSLPKSKYVAFSIQANREVTHSRHGGFRLMDLATELFHLSRRARNRIDQYVIGDRMGWHHPFHNCAIGRGIGAATVDVPIVVHIRERLDLPTEQRAVEFLGAFSVVRRNLKPDEAGGNFGVL